MATETPQWKLRRLAPRAIRIVKRRSSDSTVIATFATSMVPKAETYMETYDRSVKNRASWKKEMQEGRTAVGILVKRIQALAPLLKRDVPGFDGSVYGDQPVVPDDVIEDGERMHSVIDEFRDGSGNPLFYQKEALEELGPALQAATKEWAEAEAADSEYQKLLASVRAMGDDLQRDLVTLRRCLLVTVGRSDRDYQKLRAERAALPDEDDDANTPKPPEPVAPAAATSGVPASVS
jgi:hypothetical protein